MIFAQKIYGFSHANVQIRKFFNILNIYSIFTDDEQLLGAVKHALQHNQNGQQTLNDTWHELVNLLGNPASFLERGKF